LSATYTAEERGRLLEASKERGNAPALWHANAQSIRLLVPARFLVSARSGIEAVIENNVPRVIVREAARD
jgi:hypothetical protein